MAVDTTPERSFSLLLRSSRAAEATTGCASGFAEMGGGHHGRKRRSIDRVGSARKSATPASVLSGSA